MTFLAVLCFALLILLLLQQYKHDRERKALMDRFAEERVGLLDRIQAPQVVPFLQREAKLQHVPFDDDEAFEEATEER